MAMISNCLPYEKRESLVMRSERISATPISSQIRSVWLLAEISSTPRSRVLAKHSRYDSDVPHVVKLTSSISSDVRMSLRYDI